jgi:hypothetical protein
VAARDVRAAVRHTGPTTAIAATILAAILAAIQRVVLHATVRRPLARRAPRDWFAALELDEPRPAPTTRTRP